MSEGERSSATPEVSRTQSQTAAAMACPIVVDPSHKRSIQVALDRKKQDCPMYISSVDQTSHPGCKHYAAFCEQKARCCEMFFPCRLCHDEVIDEISDVPKHTMDRFDVRVLRCTKCGHEQNLSYGDKPSCGGCQAEFASYSCTGCMLFHNASDRDMYHCKSCRICFLGGAKGTFHCNSCDACVPKLRTGADKHRCRVNTTEADCPVCLQPLRWWMRMPVIRIPCGHQLHEECFRELARNDYRCCKCLKSMGDMGSYFNQLDQIVKEDFENMPSELRGKEVEVLCNDCLGRSRVLFHPKFRKCRAVKQSFLQDGTKECGSYNTRLL